MPFVTLRAWQRYGIERQRARHLAQMNQERREKQHRQWYAKGG